MSKVFIEESTLTSIGDAIRGKTGKIDLIPPLSMPAEIESIVGGGEGGESVIRTVSGSCPITLTNCVERSLLDYKIYGTTVGVVELGGGAYQGVRSIYTDQSVSGQTNKVGFNTGVKWSEVDEIEMLLNVITTKDQNMLMASKTSTSNDGSGLSGPYFYVSTGSIKFSQLSATKSAEPVAGEFSRIVLTKVTPTASVSGNYIWIGSWTDASWSRKNTWVEIIFRKDGDAVAHFMPAVRVSDGVAGFYDAVRGTFYSCYTAAGFVAGSLEYEGVGDLEADTGLYVIPIVVNDARYEVRTQFQLYEEDYIDFENRKVVIEGVGKLTDLPEIPLVAGSNTFDVDTTVKPSGVELSYVKQVEFNTMKTVEGQVPLTVDGVGQRMEDYKIYGAEGGVGKETKNLFDISRCGGTAAKATLDDYPGIDFMYFLDNGVGFTFVADFKENTQYTFSTLMHRPSDKAGKGANAKIGYTDGTLQSFGLLDGSITTVTSLQGKTISSIYTTAGWNSVAYLDLSVTQLEEGTEATAFELSGYVVPLKVNDTVFKIYVGMKQLGSDDYIDYENRCMVVGGVKTFVELPEIYLQNGTNTIDVDTTVKPSKMSVSCIDTGNRYKHIHGTGEVDVHNSFCNQLLENVHFSNISGEHVYTWNQLNDLSALSTSFTQNGITAVADHDTGSITVSGTATNRALIPLCSKETMSGWNTAHKYYLRSLGDEADANNIVWHTYNATTKGGIYTGSQMNFSAQYPRISVPSGTVADNMVIYPQIFDLTMMFGEGNEPTIEQFEAMFPDRYLYDGGTSYSKFSITIDGKEQSFVYQSALSEYMPEVPIMIPKGNSKMILNATVDGDYYTSS